MITTETDTLVVMETLLRCATIDATIKYPDTLKTTAWEATVKLGKQDFAWLSFYPGHFVRFSYILNLAKKTK